jgi:hypothetical protein
MTNVVDYQPFANGSGANVESQAQFLTDLGAGGTLVNGYATGLAKSTQFNKVARQSSMMAAALATFISTELNTSVLDDGNLAALTTNFTNALITLVAANAPQSTVYCGSAGGTANALVLTPSPAVTTLVTGQMAYVFLVTAANTGATTVAISALPAKNLYKDGASGPTALTGGELQIGDLVQLRYDGTQFQLDSVASMVSTTKVVSAAQSVASSNTGTYYVNTAAVTYTFVQSTVLGSNFVATIFAEGGAATIATNAGDAINGGSAGAGSTIPKGFIGTIFTNNSGALYLSISPAGSGIVTIASASTVDLGTSFSQSVNVSGTTTVTSFGSSVATSGVIYTLTFSGAMTLTYNSTSLILPGKANIITAAGDTAQFQYLGSGNWQCIDYQPASGVAIVANSIQSVSASVAANALTAGLNPTTLTFRSATLTSGATINQQITSALSITVPSTATLGTVSTVQSQLVLLVAYNAGSPVLCIANISGGLNLDETTLISPTTISSGATSASVIYSASSVGANSPFRIVGYIAITEATAGTWATAPTLVQGQGGQALSAMQSLGFGQTWQNVSASRAFGTTYYNPTNRPILVSLGVADSIVATFNLTVNGVVASSASINNYADGAQILPLTAIVPPGGSYIVTASAGTGTINTWAELR